jgi:hypothetical protein
MKARTNMKNLRFNFRRNREAELQPPLQSEVDLNAVLLHEQARTDRSGRGFAELVFECHDMNQALIQRLWTVIHRRVRRTDIIGWIPQQGIGIVLPETSGAGAWKLADDIHQLLHLPLRSLPCQVYDYPSERFEHESSLVAG